MPSPFRYDGRRILHDQEGAEAGAPLSSRYSQGMDADERLDGLEDEAQVMCPWCSESQLLYVDPGNSGRFIQDCDVCCRPWTVHVQRDGGALHVSVERA